MRGRRDSKELSGGIDLASSLPVILLFPIIYASYLLAPFTQINDALLQTILAAASIIAAVITGFLFNSHSSMKEFRLEKLARFVELQNQFKPYQVAFDRLSDQLLRKNMKIDFQLGRSLHELQRDEKLFNSDDSTAIIWVHSIYDIGKQMFGTPDFEKTGNILSKDRVDELYEAVTQAWSLLGRDKYYKHIFSTLGIKYSQHFEQVQIADSSLGMEFVADVIKKYPNEDFTTLSFWEQRLEECHDILERMQSNGRFIYNFIVPESRLLSVYLIFVSVFGVLLPLFILSAEARIQPVMPLLSNMALLGFATYFTLALIRVYKKLTSNALSIL